MPVTRSKGRTQDARTPSNNPPRPPGTPVTPVPLGNLEADLEAPMATPVPPAPVPVPPAPVVPPPPAPVALPPAPAVPPPAPVVNPPVPAAPPGTDPVLDHALRLVGFDRSRNPDHAVFQCLADGGYDTFYRLFFLNPEEVKDLAYLDTSLSPPVWVSLSRGNQSALLTLIAYQRYFKATNNGTSLTPTDWLQITEDTINNFILSSDRDLYIQNSGPPQQAATPTATLQRPSNLLNEYRKTIRRDPAQFKPLNDKRHWATWHLQFVATARAQDLQDVLDPWYVPNTPDEKAVFRAKQEYLYAVFVQNLLTDEGKTYVRAHSRDSNAQKIFKELLDHHTKSTHSQLTASSIMQFLTSFKLGVQPWKGKTTVSFIAYFVEQMRLYDDICYATAEPILSDHFKRTVLDTAVQGIDDLRQVRITQNTLCQQLNATPTFSEYLDLLQRAATIYDNHQQNRSNPRMDTGNPRKVYATVQGGYPYHDDADVFLESDPGPVGFDFSDAYNDPFSSDHGFDIDLPLSTINVFAAQQCGRPPNNPDPSIRLPDSIFSKLSQDDKRTWSRLGVDARRLILGYSNSSTTTVHPGSSVHPPSTGISNVNRRVHMSEHTSPPMLTPDALVTHTLPIPPVYGPGNDDPQDSTRLLAMMTQQHHPGDLRRLLSTSSGRPPDSGPHVPTRTINMARTYVVARADAAKHHGSQLGALVDRGANGGLAGQDCRIIAHAPDRFVNIEGLDRHQLTHIPIVSCGAYTVSRNHGPVIVVFHQFAGVMRGPTIISSGQLESFHNQVNKRSRRVDPNGQLIITNDGYEFPLHVRNGLSYLDLRPFHRSGISNPASCHHD